MNYYLKKRYYLYFIWLWGLKCNIIFVLIEGYVGLNLRNKLSSILYLIITTNIYNIIIEFMSIKKKKFNIKFINIFLFFFLFLEIYIGFILVI